MDESRNPKNAISVSNGVGRFNSHFVSKQLGVEKMKKKGEELFLRVPRYLWKLAEFVLSFSRENPG